MMICVYAHTHTHARTHARTRTHHALRARDRRRGQRAGQGRHRLQHRRPAAAVRPPCDGRENRCSGRERGARGLKMKGRGRRPDARSAPSLCLTHPLSLSLSSLAPDPYLNTDAGTMSPFEHGEVFVLDDGGEVRLVFFRGARGGRWRGASLALVLSLSAAAHPRPPCAHLAWDPPQLGAALPALCP